MKNGPGAKAFDPAGMNGNEAKLKEIKNGAQLTLRPPALTRRPRSTRRLLTWAADRTPAGRLAMVAFLGFTSQAAVRGLGPIECLKLHLSAPAKENIFTSAVGTEATIGVIVLAIAPIILKFYKEKAGEDDFRPIPWRVFDPGHLIPRCTPARATWAAPRPGVSSCLRRRAAICC